MHGPSKNRPKKLEPWRSGKMWSLERQPKKSRQKACNWRFRLNRTQRFPALILALPPSSSPQARLTSFQFLAEDAAPPHNAFSTFELAIISPTGIESRRRAAEKGPEIRQLCIPRDSKYISPSVTLLSQRYHQQYGSAQGLALTISCRKSLCEKTKR